MAMQWVPNDPHEMYGGTHGENGFTNVHAWDPNWVQSWNDAGAKSTFERPFFDRNLAEQHWQTQAGLDAQRYAVDRQVNERQREFNARFHTLRGLMGAANGMGGAQVGTAPTITAGPVWDQNQLQARVNQGRAQNDQATATKIKSMNEGLAGRGYGSHSPLAAALQGQYEGANMGQNAALENNLRWNTAEGNAQHLFQTQMGQEQQFANRQNENIDRRKIGAGSWSALVSALGGLS